MTIEDIGNNEEHISNEQDTIYPLPHIDYLHFNKSLIEGVHTDLPNPYYREQIQEKKERLDYSHPTENIIRSIIGEYGPFNELSEEKLLKLINIIDKKETSNTEEDERMDIDDETDNNNKIAKNDQTIENVEIIQTKELEFYKKRDEMLKCIREALGSSILSLDFVSLLLSSVRPAAGSSSMSPHLKQNIKIGSLSCDRIVPNISDPEEDAKQKNIDAMTVGRGLKLQSLKKSSDLLKNSIERLNKNLEDENTYWTEVLDVLRGNELITSVVVPVSPSNSAISKQSNSLKQKRVLAVKYGYGDSGSDYFDNGIAELKKGDLGHLVFEKLNQNEREKTWGGQKIVSVKIFKNSTHPNDTPELIGQSDSYGTIQKEIISNNESFVSKVKNSRFFIFENELFWHLMKEAASLITVHVNVIDSYVKVDLYDFSLHIEAIDIGSEEATTKTPDLPKNDDANKILKFFRILLCANNYKNTQKLKIPPVALSKETTIQKNKHGVLIRPIVMYSRHHNMIMQFQDMLCSLLQRTGIEEEKSKELIKNELIIKKYVNDPNLLQQFQKLKRCYNNDPFLRVYSKMAPTSLLILKHGNLKTWIELNSSYTTLHISINVKVTKIDTTETLLESTFNSKEDVEQCLSWILKQYK